ncbi:uncharacterized protein LOC131012746 [Salvia miltiorrhiza]|uniref:uncharacterized protein LOC131012744 n=1 Tax=Salvia miltiorrhiza TaxID=226208 RepID=UPI0025AD846B|nr:uncharacterized protein LOC131012744 [Salvia miltiorrhiza]XP_057796730.1 uncharacterized protein LOC131012744 [Salvia miltiorrhiza]XP_057796731.1 uncharacterized protein LOC131012746 [Salvia miltiorrhiza]
MEGLFLKRYHTASCNRNYLSLLSGEDWSVCENHETIMLPFARNSNIDGSSCGGLMYFDNFGGRIIICNPATKTFEPLDPPKFPHPPIMIIFCGSGFGYDPILDDYKVVRHYYHSYFGCIKNPGRDSKHVVEVFSLKNHFWKEIEGPVVDDDLIPTDCMTGIHVDGVCYWTSCICVISFDFTDECFSSFDLPMKNQDEDFLHYLIKVTDMLGVFRYERPPPLGPEYVGFSTTFELLVRKESSWVPWCNIDLYNVVRRPLLLFNEGQILFLEKQVSEHLYQLVVYDFKTEKLEELDIYDYPEQMTIMPYVETRFSLRYPKPMDGSYSKDEEKEENNDRILEWRRKRWMRIRKIKRRTKIMMMIRPKWWIMLKTYVKRAIRADSMYND